MTLYQATNQPPNHRPGEIYKFYKDKYVITDYEITGPGTISVKGIPLRAFTKTLRAVIEESKTEEDRTGDLEDRRVRPEDRDDHRDHKTTTND